MLAEEIATPGYSLIRDSGHDPTLLSFSRLQQTTGIFLLQIRDGTAVGCLCRLRGPSSICDTI